MAAQGAQGATAEHTVQGATVAQGTRGATAEQGARGAMAEQGTQGAMAEQGTQGVMAVQAAWGAMVEQGARGAIVEPAVQRARVAQGAQEAMAEQAVQGARVEQGARGAMVGQAVSGAMAGQPPWPWPLRPDPYTEPTLERTQGLELTLERTQGRGDEGWEQYFSPHPTRLVRGEWGSRRAWRQAGSGSGPDTLQTPEDPFPPAQSCSVWEVHRAIVIGPNPEQRVDGGTRPVPSSRPAHRPPRRNSTNGRSQRARAEKWAATSMAAEGNGDKTKDFQKLGTKMGRRGTAYCIISVEYLSRFSYCGGTRKRRSNAIILSLIINRNIHT